MRIGDLLSRERFLNGVKRIGRLRISVGHDSLLALSALILILIVAFAIRLFPLRWEIDLGADPVQLHLSEFDPYFQFRFTEYMLKNGFISWAWPEQWVDTYRWYPGGINVAIAGFPGLPMTAASLYAIFSALGVNVGLMDFCALFPAFMGMLASLVIYFFGKDIGGRPIGLLAALFLALSPSYIQRTQVGFFDDETVGVLALLLFAFFFLRSLDRQRPLSSTVKYALASGAAMGYYCASWGAAYYALGVAILYVFLMIILRRYTQRLLLSYSLTFGLGLSIATLVPKLSLGYLTTSVILPVAGLFVLLCVAEILRALRSTRVKTLFVIILLAIVSGSFLLLWQLGYMGGIAGKFISVINPLARADSPLVESVAEHRISAWGPIYYDFGIAIVFFVAGFYFLLRNLNDRNLFLLILGLTSLYFASSMVRLLVLMAVAFGLLAAIGIMGVLRPFALLLREPLPRVGTKKRGGLQAVGKEFSGAAVFLVFIILMTNFAIPMPKVYRQAWSPVTITAASLPIVPTTPVQEWLDMLSWTKSNLGAGTVVCSWWDYGYWLTTLGNVTSLADNATINTTQIQNIGFMFMANETQSIEMLRLYDASYILVFTTFDINGRWIGYGDEGKWMWMARISGQARERFVQDGFLDDTFSWTDESIFGDYNSTAGEWDWNATGMGSTVYKLMAWGKHRWCEGKVADPEVAKWSKNNMTTEDITPDYFKEAYFAGASLSASEARSNYGGIVPLVCLFEIDWQKYDSDSQT